MHCPCDPYIPADNPQQLDKASHMGGNANYKSHKSMKSGPADKTESNEGYHELYTVTRILLYRCYKSELSTGWKHKVYGQLYL